MKLIKQVKNSSVFADKILSLNSFLKDFPIPVDKALIHKNKGVILSEYSLEKYGQRLNEIYRKIIKRA